MSVFRIKVYSWSVIIFKVIVAPSTGGDPARFSPLYFAVPLKFVFPLLQTEGAAFAVTSMVPGTVNTPTITGLLA